MKMNLITYKSTAGTTTTIIIIVPLVIPLNGGLGNETIDNIYTMQPNHLLS
jgi:hypothetical protein